MINPWQKIIGIAGGLGPYAHIALEQHLLRAASEYLGHPPRDQEYPPWVVSSLPATPDRTRALIHGEDSPVPALLESIDRLAPADFAVIPCNTAHAYLEDLRESASIPILDMIGVTLRRAAAAGGRIGLLATDGTLDARVFQQRAEAIGTTMEFITLLDLDDGPQLQESLTMTPIYGPIVEGARIGGGIKSGGLQSERADALTRDLLRAVEILGEAGATSVILGCTEIPLALHGQDTRIPTIDPMEIAAQAAISIAAGEDSHRWSLGPA